MKKQYSRILTILLLLIGSLSLSSCKKDEVENYNVNFNFVWPGFFAGESLLVSNGQSINIETWEINKETSSSGVYITSVEYYFDDEKIATSKSKPYGLEYNIKNKTIGTHKLKVIANVSTDDGFNFSWPYEYSVEVVEEAPKLEFSLFLGDSQEPAEGEVKLDRNEMFTGHLALAGSTVGASITQVKYYWDGNLFDASRQSPYNFSYDISQEEIGEHVFIYELVLNSNYGEIVCRNGFVLTVQE